MDRNLQFISWDRKDFGISGIEKKGYVVNEAYKGNGCFVLKCLREAHFRTKIPFQHIWYNKKGAINHIGTFIIFDAMINMKYIQWLVKNNKDAKFIFWYWNKINNKRISPFYLKKLGLDVWSFNPLDCEQYSIKLNHTFFCDEYYAALKGRGRSNTQPKYDLSFIGKDKGRMEMVYELTHKYSNLNFFINITPTRFYLKWKDKRYKKSLAYQKVLAIEEASRAILEIVPSNSQGLTIRTMDAICLGKKLVTNNPYIKQMDFYNENNFFILGIDENLEDFLEKPYVPLSKSILNNYAFENWVGRFIAS